MGVRLIRELPWSEREAMIQEYLSTDMCKRDVWRKYMGNDNEKGKINEWMRRLGYVDKVPPLNRMIKKVSNFDNYIRSTALATSENKNSSKSNEELQREIQELKKQLELAQLKAEGYELMLEIAEKEYKIPIRKKPNTK